MLEFEFGRAGTSSKLIFTLSLGENPILPSRQTIATRPISVAAISTKNLSALGPFQIRCLNGVCRVSILSPALRRDVLADLTLPIGTYDPIVKRSVSLQIIFEGSLDAGLATSCIIIRCAMYAMRRPVMSLAIWVANLTYRARINGHMLVMFRLIAINRHRRGERTSAHFTASVCSGQQGHSAAT